MPDIAVFHPQLAHFVIALGITGVIFRLIALTGRFRFLSGAATVLLVVTAICAFLSAESGVQAHEPVEDIPGIREAIDDHEEWGERTRNLFIGIAVIELIGLAFMGEKRRNLQRYVHMASGVAGVIGMLFIYETGEHGGALVYSYGAGVGTRSKKPEDVQNALIAGLYNAAMLNRTSGRKEDAARLLAEIERLRPNDPGVRLVSIESMLKDKNDPNAALAALRGFAAGEDRGLRFRVGLLKVDAFTAAGMADSAKVALDQLIQEFPDSPSLKQRAAQMGTTAAPPPTTTTTPPPATTTTTTSN